MLKWTILIIAWLFSINWYSNFCWGEPIDGGKVAMQKNNRFKQKELIYKNISTAPSYVKIKFKSLKTEKILNMIVENGHLASYLANKNGLKMDKLGRFKDMKAYLKFIETDYVRYMIENEGKVLDIDIDNFKKFVGKTCFGEEKAAEKYLNTFIFIESLNLNDLNVNNEKELIDKYLDFDSERGSGTIKKEYYRQYSSNPAFIALLMDLGYNVGRGDIIPTLWIRK